jgi:hypothetical protein
VTEAALPDSDAFLSGELGAVEGPLAVVRARAGDALLDLRLLARATGRRLDALAAGGQQRDVLVLGVYREGGGRLPRAVAALRGSRHRVALALGSMGEAAPELAEATLATGMRGGKFQNLNELWRGAGSATPDWTVALDDDVVLPPRFVDRFLGLCEVFELDIAQPAHRLLSHAAWPVTRRRAGSLLRETRFVEIGPVTAFSRRAAGGLLPFPELRFGWGLDVHWSALAAERGWRLGIVDALPVRHEGGVAGAYSSDEAIAEARRFLAERPYVTSAAAAETIAVHPP